MKKLLLVFAMLFASVSSSFAYQQETLWITGGYGSQNSTGSTVYVNSSVGAISLSASFNNAMSYTPSGMVSAYADGVYSDVYYYNGPNNGNYNNTVYFDYYNQPYITSVNFYIWAQECYGQATLTIN